MNQNASVQSVMKKTKFGYIRKCLTGNTTIRAHEDVETFLWNSTVFPVTGDRSDHGTRAFEPGVKNSFDCGYIIFFSLKIFFEATFFFKLIEKITENLKEKYKENLKRKLCGKVYVKKKLSGKWKKQTFVFVRKSS